MDIFDFFGLDDNFVILNIFLQVTLFSAVAILAARYFKHNAAVRYAILYPALLSLCVLVVASLVLQTSSRNLFFIPITTTSEQPGSLALGELPPDYFLDAAALELFQLPLSVELSSFAEGGEQITTALAAEQNTTINTPWELLLSLPLYLIIAVIWVGGFLFLTIGLLRSFHNVEMMSRHSKSLRREDRALLNSLLAQHLSDVDRLRFRTSSRIDSPVLAGLISPVVLLPSNFVQELNHQQLKNILLHELAHYARSDAMANFLQKVCLAVFWFHPLVHVMDGMICRAREEICDNYVLSEEDAINYGETLLHVSSFSSYKRNGSAESQAVNTKTTINSRAGDIQLAMGVFSSEWKLEQRISELLSDHREKTMKLATSTNRAVQAALVCFSISLAACQVGAAENFASINADAEPQASQAPNASAAPEPVEPVEPIQNVAEVREQQQRIQELEEREAGAVQLDMEQLSQRLESERQRIQQEAERLELRARELEQRAREIEEEFSGKEDELVQRMDEVRRRMEELDPAEIEREVRENIDIEALQRDIEESIDVEEIERTVYAAMEQLRQNLEEIREVIREQGDSPDLEQINELLERSFNDSLSPDQASEPQLQLPEDAQRRLQLMRQYLMADQSGLADLEQRLENIAGQFPLPGNAAYLNSYASADSDQSPAAQPRYIQVQDTTQPTQSQSTQQRATGVLGPAVMREITAIQELMAPSSDEVEPDIEAAKLALDTLYDQRFERMNDFEKQTLLNFYTNYYLQEQSYGEAIGVFERLLTVPSIPNDTQLRTLRSLGQLYATEEQWQESIAAYAQWRQASTDENELVYKGLSYGYYQLEDFTRALPYWQSYMDLQRTQEAGLGREDYLYLNGLYFVLEDFEAALENTKQMILLFNQQKDWDNLRAIFARLNQEMDVELDAQEQEQLLGALSSAADSQATADSSSQTSTSSSSQTAQRVPSLAAKGDYLPLVAVAPQYPTRAAQSGIQGWSLLRFDVDAGGDVDEDSITVVDAEPANVFDRSSIRALGRFKYQPPLENGTAVAVADVQYLFRYQLQQ